MNTIKTPFGSGFIAREGRHVYVFGHSASSIYAVGGAPLERNFILELRRHAFPAFSSTVVIIDLLSTFIHIYIYIYPLTPLFPALAPSHPIPCPKPLPSTLPTVSYPTVEENREGHGIR